MRYLTAAVIGHVDHGKTALVRALTGRNTDRLKEEQERGISIALGFAPLDLPSGRIGLIDAPGHERFIRTMIGGTTGSDAAILVVDVGEGVMPQTREHLAIAQFLGMRGGVIVLTKCDAHDADTIELAEEEICEYAGKTFLADARVVRTSAQDGVGIEDLRAALDTLLQSTTSLSSEEPPYLPIDRVFSMAGHGTVVTGTLRCGEIRPGDEMTIQPGNHRATVRSVQCHGEQVEVAPPGRRVAVNLRNISATQLERGDVLCAPNAASTVGVLNAEFTLLSEAAVPLKQRQRVRILTGTRECFGRVHLLDREALEPGTTAFMQFVLETPIPILPREGFIVRRYSPLATLGGGGVLGGQDGRASRKDGHFLEWLAAISEMNFVDIVKLSLARAPATSLDLVRLARDLRLSLVELREAAGALPVRWINNSAIVSTDIFVATERTLLDRLGASGNVAQESLLAGIDSLVAHAALNTLLESNQVVQESGGYRIPSAAAFSPEDAKEVDEIRGAFRAAGLTPPRVVDVLRNDKSRMQLYRVLVDRGELVPVWQEGQPRIPTAALVFHCDTIEETQQRIREHFGQNQFETSELKNFLGISRKYLIPLVEHFDASGFTTRTGNARRISAP